MVKSTNPEYAEAEKFLKNYIMTNSNLHERSDAILGREIKANIVISEISERFVEAYSKMKEFQKQLEPEYFSIYPQIKNGSLILEAHPEKVQIGIELSLSLDIGVYRPEVIFKVPQTSLVPETFRRALDLRFVSGEVSSNCYSMEKYRTLGDFDPKEAASKAKDKLNKLATFLRKSTRIDLNTS